LISVIETLSKDKIDRVAFGTFAVLYFLLYLKQFLVRI